MTALNPTAMSVNEIAAQATRQQLVDGINRVNAIITSGRGNADWTALHAKLAAALRIQLTPNRIITTPAPRGTGRHASPCAEFAGHTTDGLARFIGARI
jgi:hypothetical protein